MPLSIIQYPHPTLRYRSKPIRRVDKDLRAIADEMLHLMYEFNGVGLAANQVNLPLRMFVANPSGQRDEGEEMILVNPELQMPRGNESDQEGCLSLPGLFGQVKRPKAIRLSAYDLKGNAIERDVDGFLARVLMHENDHLDGVLFFDRMSEEGKRELLDPLGEFETDFRSQQSTGAISPDEELIAGLAEWTKRYA
ncbi:Peptide deformylase [Planctomycetes bacterium CA13]|uniref:Peptide deformylase n=1 Tax=Novipirellula herctigrandis TaxID=2527986 RepID=A0A5C5YND7_9BACT|nr:Peptide deformylase [Planctomycetes bacterium CA13]